MTFSGICFYCLKKFWQLLAVLLVLTAVLISLLKYSLPYISGYNEDIQRWIKQNYNADIYIGHISADWQGANDCVAISPVKLGSDEDRTALRGLLRKRKDVWGLLLNHRAKQAVERAVAGQKEYAVCGGNRCHDSMVGRQDVRKGGRRLQGGG